MSENKNQKLELEEYMRQGGPDQVEENEIQQTATDLQTADGLKISEYLLEAAKAHIEGKIGIDTAQRRTQSYYEERKDRIEVGGDTREADIVSSRAVALLGGRTFRSSPAEWQKIHRRLLDGILDSAGGIRPYNIAKKEWVLKGGIILYTSCKSIQAILDYGFNKEKQFSHAGLSILESIRRVTEFILGIPIQQEGKNGSKCRGRHSKMHR